MATQLELVNKILRRLREDTVSSVAENSYSQLIAQFVNDAKADLEDIESDWEQYRTINDITILGDSVTVDYVLTGSNDRTWIPKTLRNSEIPLAFDVTTDELGQLYYLPTSMANEIVYLSIGTPIETPRVFYTYFDDTTGELGVSLLNPSLTQRDWRIVSCTPQEDLSLNGDDDHTVVKLPNRPVELRALYYALNERGEEMGEPGGIAWVRSENAFAAALENNRQVLGNWITAQITNTENI